MDSIGDVYLGSRGIGGRQSGKYLRGIEVGSTFLAERMAVDLWEQVYISLASWNG